MSEANDESLERSRVAALAMALVQPLGETM